MRARFPAILVALGGCGSPGAADGPGANPDAGLDSAVEPSTPAPSRAPSSLLVRGVIGPDTLSIDPVFHLPDAPATAMADDGEHRLIGRDDQGEILFDVRFETVPVSTADARSPQHFALRVPVTEKGAGSLQRVELHTGDGRSAVRVARFSARELSDLVAADDAAVVRRLAPGRVRIVWDAERFPMVLVTEPATGHVLSFGRDGELLVTTHGDALDVTFSEGVRSRLRTLALR